MIDYSHELHNFLVRREHLFRDKIYHLSIFEDKIIMGERKHDQNPKYLIPLNLQIKISWVTLLENGEITILGFQFQYLQGQKIVKGDHKNFEIMKNLIAGKVIFRQISDFYDPQQFIGKGSSANVILCKCLKEKTNFAIKAIDKSYIAQNDKDMESFIMEVSILRKLSDQQKQNNNKQFITLYGVFEGEMTLYLVMDLMKGKSLEHEIKKKKRENSKLSSGQVKIIMRQLMKGVAYMHEQQIIHRDLKPENIMFEEVDEYNSLRIIDFGLATFKNVEKFQFYRCGTPGYVAPEILNSKDKDEKYTEACDIFSCGVIFYKLLTGHSVFGGNKFNQLINLNKQCNIDWGSQEMLSLHPDEQELLKRMLTKDPKTRITAIQCLYETKYFSGHQTAFEITNQTMQIQASLPDYQGNKFDIGQKLISKGSESNNDLSQLNELCQQDEVQIRVRNFPTIKKPSFIQPEEEEQKHQTPRVQYQNSYNSGRLIEQNSMNQSFDSNPCNNSFYTKDPLSALHRRQVNLKQKVASHGSSQEYLQSQSISHSSYIGMSPFSKKLKVSPQNQALNQRSVFSHLVGQQKT